jgi:hypothetical protein
LVEEINNGESNDENTVNEMLDTLNINKEEVKFYKRLKKRSSNSTNSTNSASQQTSPPLLLIQFNNKTAQRSALTNSKELKKSQKFNRVYINQDRTESQRRFDKQLRDERNNRTA